MQPFSHWCFGVASTTRQMCDWEEWSFLPHCSVLLMFFFTDGWLLWSMDFICFQEWVMIAKHGSWSEWSHGHILVGPSPCRWLRNWKSVKFVVERKCSGATCFARRLHCVHHYEQNGVTWEVTANACILCCAVWCFPCFVWHCLISFSCPQYRSHGKFLDSALVRGWWFSYHGFMVLRMMTQRYFW